MPEKTARIRVRKISEHHVPTFDSSDTVSETVIAEALAMAGIAEDDPRIVEFRAIARNAGGLAAKQLLDIDTQGVTIESVNGRVRSLVTEKGPASGRPHYLFESI